MALMRSPDGTEEFEVPDAEVARLQGMGATLAAPAPTGSAEARSGPTMAQVGGGLGAIAAAGAGLKYGLPAAGRVINQASREPGLAGMLPRLGRAAIGKPAQAPLAVPPAPPPTAPTQPLQMAPPAMPPAPKMPAGVTLVTEADKARIPGLKLYEVGDEITRGELAKFKRPDAPGSAASRTRKEPTRPITVEGKPAKAPAAVAPNGPGVGKGASGPKLARRAAARAAVKETGAVPRAPAGSAASRVAPIAAEGMSDLERQLAASLEATGAARTIGVAPKAMFKTLRGGGPPAVQLLMMLLGAPNLDEEVQNTPNFLEEFLPPEEREIDERMRRRYPQGA